jgi:hypothetical protein
MAGEEELTLALLAAETVVAAARTDVWTETVQQFVGLLSRAGLDRSEVERQLEQTRQELAITSALRWKIQLATDWENRLAAVLEDQPELTPDLQLAVRELRNRLGVPVDKSLYPPPLKAAPRPPEPDARHDDSPGSWPDPDLIPDPYEGDRIQPEERGYKRGFRGPTPPGGGFGDDDDDDPYRK